MMMTIMLTRNSDKNNAGNNNDNVDSYHTSDKIGRRERIIKKKLY